MSLFAFLRPDRERLDTLERRLAALEAGEEARTVAFLDIAERVKRHLFRSAAIEQRTKDREEASKPGIPDPVTAAVLSLKFPKQQGGS